MRVTLPPTDCRCRLSVIVGLFLLGHATSLLGADKRAVEQENRRCLNCHRQTRIATIPQAEREAMVRPQPGAWNTRAVL